MINKIKENNRIYIISLIFSFVLAVIIFRVFDIAISGYSKRVLLGLALLILFVIVFPVICAVFAPFRGYVERRINNLIRVKNYVENNRKIFLKWIGLFILFGPIVNIICNLITYNHYIGCSISAVAYVILIVIIYSKKSGLKPEGLFASIAIVVGAFSIAVLPAVPGVCTDEDTHFQRIVGVANFFTDVYYQAEKMVEDEHASVVVEHKGYDKESRDSYYEALNTSYANKEVLNYRMGDKGIYSVAYIPAALGMLIGKGLSLNFVGVLQMTKLFNYLMYVLLMYYAIKRLRSGKILFAALGLIPSNIFLASNFAYDMWVFGFFALGFAYFISMHQSEEKLETKDIILMYLFFLLGAIPKAVYIVIAFPLVFMPKNRFKSTKQRAGYYLFMLIVGMILAWIVLKPMLFSATGGADMRGGADVSTSGQLAFIKENPLRYCSILFGFLANYINPINSSQIYQFYAYLGRGSCYLLVFAVIAVVAFLDRNSDKNKILAIRISAIIGAAVGLIVVASSMYIAFTPVANPTINGCQPRYVLPLLIPFFYYVIPDGICIIKKKNWLANASALLMAMTFIYNIVNLSVRIY